MLPNIVGSRTESEIKNNIDAIHNFLSVEAIIVLHMTKQQKNIYMKHKQANMLFFPRNILYMSSAVNIIVIKTEVIFL